MDHETFELLGAADLEALRRQLLTYVTRQARHYHWHRGGVLELAEGQTVEDVVQEVITKALTGVRKWDPLKGPLGPWLQSQARSIIDALARSAAHRREVSFWEMEYLRGQPPDPLSEVLAREEQAQVSQQIDALLQAVAADEDLTAVLESVLRSGETRPRYLAADLGVTVDDIYRRLRRLRRHASRYVR